MAGAKARRLLKPEEAARMLSVSAKSIRQWLRQGKLRGVKAGKLWRTTGEAVDEFLRGRPGASGGPGEAAPEKEDVGSSMWLETDLSRLGEIEPYDWAPGEIEQGKPLRFVPGKGVVIGERRNGR